MGLLAVGLIANQNHAFQFRRNSTQLCGKTTVFTHGSDQLASELQALIGKRASISIEISPIQRLTLVPHGGAQIELEHGTNHGFSFLAHAPSTRPRSPLVEQLGFEPALPLNDIQLPYSLGQLKKQQA